MQTNEQTEWTREDDRNYTALGGRLRVTMRHLHWYAFVDGENVGSHKKRGGAMFIAEGLADVEGEVA